MNYFRIFLKDGNIVEMSKRSIGINNYYVQGTEAHFSTIQVRSKYSFYAPWSAINYILEIDENEAQIKNIEQDQPKREGSKEEKPIAVLS